MTNPYFSVLPLVANTVARAADVNARFNGVVAAFDKLPDPIKLVQSRVTYAVDTGPANTMVVALSPAPSSYVDGLELTVKVAATSTTASTINVNGLGAVSVRRVGGTLTEAGDFAAGQIIKLVYDSTLTGFRLLNTTEQVITAQLANAAASASLSAIYAVGADSFSNEAAASAGDAYASKLDAEAAAVAAAASAASINDSGLVHKTGNETVGGTKTFSSAIVASGGITINGQTLDGMTSFGVQLAEAADANAARTLIGGANWTLITTVTLASNASVQQTNLANYNELLVVLSLVRPNTGSSGLQLATSENNGSSYNGSVNVITTDTSTPISGAFHVALTGRASMVVTAPETSNGVSRSIVQTAKANAIRLEWPSATFGSGGTIYIYAR